MQCKQNLQVQTMGGDGATNTDSKGPFEGILGSTIELKVIEHLLCLPSKDFNISELARSAGVSRPAADRVAKKFAKWGIVETLPKRGNMTFYRLNERSQFVQSIHTFDESASMALVTKFSDAIKTAPSTPAPAIARTRRIRKLKAFSQRNANRESVLVSSPTLANEIDIETAEAADNQRVVNTFRDDPSGR